jgi:hypothetical protein
MDEACFRTVRVAGAFDAEALALLGVRTGAVGLRALPVCLGTDSRDALPLETDEAV